MASTNLEKYMFFDYATGDGDEYKYTAHEFGDFTASLTANGVAYNFGNRFKTTASGLSLNIESGAAFINGHYGYNTTATTLTASPVNAGETRNDILAAELDEGARIMRLTIVEGGALGANQIPIASFTVQGGAATSTISQITDARSFTYTASTTPSARIIYSETEPAYEEGAIWLKPVQG